MAAPTEQEVKALISNNGFKAAIDAAFVRILETTNLVIDGRLADSEYTVALKDNIKLWFAAHLVSMSNYRQMKQSDISSFKAVFTGEFKRGLEATTFGQTVKMLDYKGILAADDTVDLNGGNIYIV